MHKTLDSTTAIAAAAAEVTVSLLDEQAAIHFYDKPNLLLTLFYRLR
jgi:hypothetical protein